MIRSRIGYLNRLVERLLDLKRQVEFAKFREIKIKSNINEISNEVDAKTTELLQLKKSSKNVINIVSSYIMTESLLIY